MAVYSYAQLETLWINAGGPRALAPIAAAIGEAESGGNSDALNPTDNNGTQSSFGIWQISNGTHTPPSPNWANPAVNAQLAVGKWKNAGGFSPWGTYTSGAYRAFLNGKTAPDPNVPGNPSGVSAQVGAQLSVDCLVGNPFSASIGLGPVSVGSSVGPACLFTRSNARAFIGGGLFILGILIAVPGVMSVAFAVGERAGRVLLAVPGVQQIQGSPVAKTAAAVAPKAAAPAKAAPKAPGPAPRQRGGGRTPTRSSGRTSAPSAPTASPGP